MKVSVVTVCLNASATIADTLESLASQIHQDIEHIVIDGGSTDATIDIIKSKRTRVAALVSEPDNGLYDAINKGLALASGDIVGILNADDVYQDENVVSAIVSEFENPEIDAVYADLVYVDRHDTARVRRKYTSGAYQAGLCFDGWMPAHPTLYMRREIHQKIGSYDLSVGAQADLEYCARAFEIHKIRSRYLAKVCLRMRLGGVSNSSSLNRIKANWRSYQALKKLGMDRNALSFFIRKFARKLPGFFA